MTQNPYLWLIPTLPLAGAAINGFMGRRSSKKAVTTLALTFPGLAFALALKIALGFSSAAAPYVFNLAHWIRSGSLGLPNYFTADFAFYLDQLSLVMLLVVTGVGFLIHIYSVGYMSDDPSYYRFFSYLNLFMFFMLTLVLANNYLMMFVGWEGVGLASYLLIGFWFTKDSAASAGKKAFIVNRIGDFGFLIGLFLIIQHFGSLNFTDVFAKVQPLAAETSGAGLLTAIGILLMVGACGKSAQIPLYVWLPDAMEGPTPVSALIHAATMVTAGVYMVARSHVIFERTPIALTVVAVIGTLTALFAATIGIAQTDIKKVLAYSTVSQLGYMFMACGAGAFSAGIFHLMTHAFFKGLLFLGAGSVIHAVGGEQDMRKMGGLKTYIPITFTTMLIATLAISGIPPLAGFWSKDEILWKAYQASWVYWLIGAITALITSFYMFRLLFMTFWGDYKGIQIDDHGHAHAAPGHEDHGHGEPHESPMVMLVPLIILAVLSAVGGFVGIHNGFEHFLEPVFGSEFPKTITEGSGNTEWLLMGISVLFAFTGLILAYVLYVSKPYLPDKIAASMNGFYELVLNKYYVDEIYAKVFVKPLVDGSTKILWQGVDRRVIDDTVNNAADGARHVSDEVRHMQSGNVRSYAGWIASGAAVVIAYMIWWGMR
ncbi:MAG TPA: NADH-quinone oxidoreductase subunit L [Candidatus Sulfotelmatobacter sp.]|jgi:NADH-quinone oxidoreductase subunit L|nr:NADH-quinone oxidoreductase subunit L [Candidatus Sulfotelmatobacter sp.]